MTRRKFAGLSAAALVGTYAGIKLQRPPKVPDGPAGKSAVAIIRARSYSDDLVSRMLQGIRECGLDVRGKRVLLKPNLVEFDAATVINTDAAVIAAALEVFHQLGALEVKIGEGPGHRRDTLDLADDARYRASVPKFDKPLYGLESGRRVAGARLCRRIGVLLSQHRAGRGFDRLARQNEDASLGRRHAVHEKLLWHRSGIRVWMAEEQAALPWDCRIDRGAESPIRKQGGLRLWTA